MRRLRYLLGLLDARDRWAFGGALAAALVIAAGLGYVHGKLEAREARERDCARRVMLADAAVRARGLSVVRVAMPECPRP